MNKDTITNTDIQLKTLIMGLRIAQYSLHELQFSTSRKLKLEIKRLYQSINSFMNQMDNGIPDTMDMLDTETEVLRNILINCSFMIPPDTLEVSDYVNSVIKRDYYIPVN